MLKKCLRYDLKSVSTYWIFGAIAMLLMSIPGGLALRSQTIHANDIDHFPWEVFVLLVVYFVGAAFLILSEILIYVRYYKHFFSDEGYLTFTLPVKRRVLFTSKVLNGVIWQALTVIVIAFSVIIMFLFVPSIPSDTIPPEIAEPLIPIGWVLAYLLEGLALLVIYAFLSVLSMYLIIAIGATIVRKNKVIVTIGLVYGASIALSILSWVLIFVGGFYIASAVELFPEGPSNIGLFIFLILLLAIAVLFTIAVSIALITLRIIERKLNLA